MALSSHKSRFWITVAATCVLVAVTSAVGHLGPLRYFAPLHHPPTNYVMRYRFGRKPVDVLVLGSSRVKSSVMPPVVQEQLAKAGLPGVKVAKLGVPGIEFYGQYLLLRDLVRGPHAPRLLVLEVAARSFNRNNSRLIFDLVNLGAPSDMVSFLARRAKPDERTKVLMGLFKGPMFTSELALVAFFRPRRQNPIMVPEDMPDEMTEVLALKSWDKKTERLCALEAQTDFYQHHVDRFMERVAEETIRLARRRGMTVVLVNFPNTKDYQRRCVPPVAQERYERLIASLKKRTRVPFVRYPDMDRMQGKDDFFNDPEHMSPAGARHFSARLARDVIRPYLEQRKQP